MVEEQPIVANASPLIAFARLKRLSLLRSLFGTVLVPRAVWAELSAKDTEDSRLLKEAREDGWLVVCEPEDEAGLPEMLDEGELAAIALARTLEPCRLLMDERSGRRAAHAAGCSVIGTLGVLVLAKQRGEISEVRPLILRLQDTLLFRIAGDLVNSVLRAVGELPEQES